MLEELQNKYLASLPGKISELEQLSARYHTDSTKASQQIRALAHTLHGSGSSFGLPALSTAAADVELAPERELLSRLNGLIKILHFCSQTSSTTEKNLRLLVVTADLDYYSSLYQAFKHSSKKFKYAIDHVESAHSAHQALTLKSYDLILLDLMLPDQDGRDFLRNLKTEYFIKTPVYVLSPLEQDMVRIECMSLGAEKYLAKQLSTDDIVFTINHYLSNKPRLELNIVAKGAELQRPKEFNRASQDVLSSDIKILVAEDDEHLSNLVSQRLLKEGFTVDQTFNGQDALNKLRQHPPELCILDVNMPAIDGFEVLRRLRADLKTKAIPVIMLTAMGSERDIIHAYELGTNDYILKPFSATQLVARVKSLLKLKSAN